MLSDKNQNESAAALDRRNFLKITGTSIGAAALHPSAGKRNTLGIGKLSEIPKTTRSRLVDWWPGADWNPLNSYLITYPSPVIRCRTALERRSGRIVRPAEARANPQYPIRAAGMRGVLKYL